MFSWLFGSSTGKEEAPSQKVEDAILEARIVKDFYDRMITMCSQKCKGSSADLDDQVVVNNCMDRCAFKYEETKNVVERVLEQQSAEKA